MFDAPERDVSDAMKQDLKQLLQDIQELEAVVSEKIQQKGHDLQFKMHEGKVVFEAEIRQRHKALAKRLHQYLLDSSLLKIVTAPLIYFLFFPLLLLDAVTWVYQTVCFPIYDIPKVQRRDYIAIDRYKLSYLNAIERFNCDYCSYANGLIAFVREVAARTEQHWCPIKHSRKVKGCHDRHCLFCEYGDAVGFRKRFDELRGEFKDIENIRE